MSAPLVPSRGLIYPTGVNAGINSAHPASIALRLSAVASGGGMVNLVTGKPGTNNGTVTQANWGPLGPTVGFFSNGSYVSFPTLVSESYTGLTLGIIFWATAVPSAATLINTDAANSGNENAFFFYSGGIGTFTTGTVLYTGLPVPTPGIPYFLAVTGSSGAAYGPNGFGVLVNLATGQQWTSIANGAMAAQPSQSHYAVGGTSAGGQYSDSYVAAAMIAKQCINTDQLLAWAKAPWDFWYPPTASSLLFSGLKQGSTLLTATIASTDAKDTVSINAASSVNATISTTDVKDTVSIQTMPPTPLQSPSFVPTPRRLRSPLAFPGGNAGYNPRHPITTGGLRLSAVATSNGSMTDLLAGQPPTNSISPTFTGAQSPIGPVIVISQSSNVFQMRNPVPDEEWTSYTGAAIFRYEANANNDNANVVAVPGTYSELGWGLNTTSSQGQMVFSTAYGQSATFSPAPPILNPGDLWFIAATGGPQGTAYVQTNLKTGQVYSGTGGQAYPTNATGTAWQIFGRGSTDQAAQFAAVMAANQYTPLNALLAWAQAPWDFWYPTTVTDTILSGLRYQSPITGTLSTTDAQDIVRLLANTGSSVDTHDGGYNWNDLQYDKYLRSRKKRKVPEIRDWSVDPRVAKPQIIKPEPAPAALRYIMAPPSREELDEEEAAVIDFITRILGGELA